MDTTPAAGSPDALATPVRSDAGLADYSARLLRVAGRHALLGLEWWARLPALAPTATGAPDFAALAVPAVWAAYWVDRVQRTVLFADALRRRANDFVRHEEGASRPVLAFESLPVLDGATLPRPVNYALVRIVPPEGWLRREDGRPYLIIDPRAGNGSGIGGFKDESEVGCALRGGHPVYFAVFARDPMPGQTLADVCEAEAEFVREVRRRHPGAPKPVVVGNCQGGWAAMLLAATHPDVTGPVVANGAPLSYWAGEVGRNTMRYAGGWTGGSLPVLWLSDLAGERFDGANLVLNFEVSNPGRTWWTKHYDAWSRIDDEAETYLTFERWWGAFYFMTGEEMRWIVDNLFVGNRLGRGRAMLDEGTHVDLRRIQSPVVVFASHGDAITPPQQALNWILDHYSSVEEIRARGQRIVYTLHDGVGHLGIFVSSEVAMREHSAIISTLKAIEALVPGLYEMVITDVVGEGLERRYRVAFEERSLADVASLDDGRDDEPSFAAVARMSDLAAEWYDLTGRPWARAIGRTAVARAAVALHPLRVQRYPFSDRNPAMATVEVLAEWTRRNRLCAGEDSEPARLERAGASLVGHGWDGVAAWRAFVLEWGFFAAWGTPWARETGRTAARHVSDAPRIDLRALETVQDALDRIDEGGFAAGLVRMLILLARSRGAVRRSRLERANRVLESEPPLSEMTPKHRTRLVHRQSLIVAFEPQEALARLPRLFESLAMAERALRLCVEVSGAGEPGDSPVRAEIDRIASVLGLSGGFGTTGTDAAAAA
jgi:pimeloyl-ACP methyl ester carboxylesterase/tellurite resistance protein